MPAKPFMRYLWRKGTLLTLSPLNLVTKGECYAEELCYMRKADQGIFRVPVRVVRREDNALQALQADLPPLHVQVMREDRAVSALFALML